MTGIIVVGVDGSETALRAAHTARDLAASVGATLHVVSAFDSDRTQVFASGGDKWIVSDAGNAEEVARTVAEGLRRPDTNVTYAAARGIVVGNRRMHGIGRVLGSVANSVAHNAPCDVYIAKTDAD
jgi:nucleotide-binding universal stress UspA family protein